ncbi:MAG TPA: energy-coupling factor transporter ATPase [Firmicutes bacterium]|nr:energy-coupling factor transporter ATPase [Bacillota bacterium]
MKLIEINNLSYSYDGKVNVLDGISFDVNKGEYVSIIGHNGSGKSTIARLLIGLLDSKSTSIKAFNLEYNRQNIREIRSHIGIVFQNPDNQFIGSTVRDDIAFGLENRNVPQKDMDKIINEFVEKVNMSKFIDKEPTNLSGGQKQRVAIAGVLAMNPDIIIFDEATSMLDPKGKLEIKHMVDSLKHEKPDLTIISITHDVEEAFSSDRIIVLSSGKIAFDLSPKELIKHKDELLKMGLDIPFKEKLKDSLLKEGLDKVVKDLCL